MQPKEIISQLQKNKGVFQWALDTLNSDQYLFRKDDNSWNLLEIVCHLWDEEKEDFRARVAHVLATPEEPLKPISPEKWPVERNYLEQDFHDTVKAFLLEREKSIVWLKSLQEPKWEQAVYHPDVGLRSAKKFLINWLAHDYHHIRQINHINYAYLKHTSGDDLTYAGKW